MMPLNRGPIHKRCLFGQSDLVLAFGRGRSYCYAVFSC